LTIGILGSRNEINNKVLKAYVKEKEKIIRRKWEMERERELEYSKK
jgi:hypothetical protein